MARVPWVFLAVFVLLPLAMIVLDIAYLSKNTWTVPWLALVGMIWFGIGIVVGIGAVETEPART